MRCGLFLRATRLDLARAARCASGQLITTLARVRCRSIEHDLRQLDKLAFKVARTTHTTLDCHTGPRLKSYWWAPLAAVGLWPAAWFLRGRLYRKKLEKLY